MSVSFAAVELAKKIFAGLDGKAVLLVGAGKMSELAARHLVEQGVFPVYVTNRTWARAQEMARALAGTAVPFDELGTAARRRGHRHHLHGRIGAGDPARDGPTGHARTTAGRPLFFIDIAVPRDVEGTVDTLDGGVLL